MILPLLWLISHTLLNNPRRARPLEAKNMAH